MFNIQQYQNTYDALKTNLWNIKNKKVVWKLYRSHMLHSNQEFKTSDIAGQNPESEKFLLQIISKLNINGAEWWQSNLSKCLNLKEIVISKVFEAQDQKQFIAEIQKLKKIQNNPITNLSFKLSYQNIQDQGINNIVNTLKEFKSLSNLTLDLAITSIGQEAITRITEALKELTSLQNLSINLSGNTIENSGFMIASALKKIKSLKVLSIDLLDTFTDSENVFNITKALKELKFLSNLILCVSNLSVGEEGIKNVAAELKEIKALQNLNLNLSYSFIKQQDITSISASLQELKSVSCLNLILSTYYIDQVTAEIDLKELKALQNVSIFLQENSTRMQGTQINIMSGKINKQQGIVAVTQAQQGL